MPPTKRRSGNNRRRGTAPKKTNYRQTGKRPNKLDGGKSVFFVAMAALFVLFFSAVDSFKRRKDGTYNKKAIAVVLFVVFAILALSGYGVYYLLTNINSQIIYLNETKIGQIKLPKDGPVSSEYIMDLAKKKLEAQVGSGVVIKDTVMVEPYHSPNNDYVTMDYVISEIVKKFNYQIQAASVVVEGKELAVVINETEAMAILDIIKQSYYQNDLNITHAEFIEDMSIVKTDVDKDKIYTREQAISALTAKVRVEETYTVKSGDTLEKIAKNSRMTLNELYQANPQYTPETLLRPGDSLVLASNKPVLSVKTFEEYTYPAVIPKPIEYVVNYSMPKAHTKVLQQGKEGQEVITAYIVRINGYEQEEREIIDRKVTIPPITEIIEVGGRDV